MDVSMGPCGSASSAVRVDCSASSGQLARLRRPQVTVNAGWTPGDLTSSDRPDTITTVLESTP
jgi:hypothetical protein